MSLDQCAPVADAFGFGIRIEGQCTPASYVGPAHVVEAKSGDYYIALDDAPTVAGCSLAPRLWLAVPAAQSQPALVVGQALTVNAWFEAAQPPGGTFSYVTLRDARSGTLSFAEYNADDRYFEGGVIAIGDNLRLSLGDECAFEAPCYLQATRFRVIDADEQLALSENESGDLVIGDRPYRVFVTNARRQEGRVSDGQCAAGHYEPGHRVYFDVMALSSP